MRALAGLICTALRDRRGATALEYGFILALIVIAIMASLSSVADATVGMWGNVSNNVQAASR